MRHIYENLSIAHVFAKAQAQEVPNVPRSERTQTSEELNESTCTVTRVIETLSRGLVNFFSLLVVLTSNVSLISGLRVASARFTSCSIRCGLNFVEGAKLTQFGGEREY